MFFAPLSYSAFSHPQLRRLSQRLFRDWTAPSVDWSRTLPDGAEISRREGEENRRKLYASRIASSSLSRGLATYAGTYGDTLYGHAVVRVRTRRLTLWFGPRHSAPLEHWDGDRFMARWENPACGERPVTFTVENGMPTRLESGGIAFRRKPSDMSVERHSSPSVQCS